MFDLKNKARNNDPAMDDTNMDDTGMGGMGETDDVGEAGGQAETDYDPNLYDDTDTTGGTTGETEDTGDMGGGSGRTGGF